VPIIVYILWQLVLSSLWNKKQCNYHNARYSSRHKQCRLLQNPKVYCCMHVTIRWGFFARIHSKISDHLTFTAEAIVQATEPNLITAGKKDILQLWHISNLLYSTYGNDKKIFPKLQLPNLRCHYFHTWTNLSTLPGLPEPWRWREQALPKFQ